MSIRFVPPGLFTLDRGFAAYVTLREGDTGLDRLDTVLLSSAMAASLGVRAGDKVNILTTGRNLAGPPRLTPVGFRDLRHRLPGAGRHAGVCPACAGGADPVSQGGPRDDRGQGP